MNSDIRITLFLARPTWMGNGTIHRGSDLLGIFPQRTGRMVCLARPPFGFTFGEFRVGQFYVKPADDGVDFDDVAIAQQRYRSADGGFRPNMADAEAAGGAGEAAVGDQRDLATHALAGERRRGREHFAHAGAALGP